MVKQDGRTSLPEEVRQLPPLTVDEESILETKIFWIVSSGRSGSSWLTDMLKNPEIVLWIEPFIGEHLGVIGKKTRDPQTKKIRTITRYDLASKRSDYFFSTTHKINWFPVLKNLVLMRAYSQAQTIKKKIIIKDPTINRIMDLIFECFPNSNLIYLIRDGRDNVDSHIAMHGEDTWAKLRPIPSKNEKINLIRDYSNNWCENQERISTMFKKIDPKKRLMIKYEDLRTDTLSIVKKIYDFLNIEISEKKLKKIVDKNDWDNIPDSKKGPKEFRRSALIGGWKKNFTDDEQKLMNSIMGETLEQFGYEV